MDQDHNKDNQDHRDKHSHDPVDEPELVSLLELQKFISDELSQFEGSGKFGRAFTPLTHGLGLESPEEPKKVTQPEVKRTPARRPKRRLADSLVSDEDSQKKEPTFFKEPKPAESAPAVSRRPRPSQAEQKKNETRSLGEVMSGPKTVESPRQTISKVVQKAVEPQVASPVEVAPPPELPAVSWSRSMFAALFDEVFVLALWAGTFFLTSWTMSQGSWDLLRSATDAALMRFAILAFATLWFGYLTVCLGVLDMTVGMWAWGMRVHYNTQRKEGRMFRRVARILLTFVFFAPVLPVLLLVFRAKGRNLLDFLSGCRVYRTS